VPHPRGADLQRATRTACLAIQAEIELTLTGSQTLLRHSLDDLNLRIIVRRPMCSMSREPRREEYTICTAVAPEAVFTVRTYATRRA
jgi:hypothetical protein